MKQLLDTLKLWLLIILWITGIAASWIEVKVRKESRTMLIINITYRLFICIWFSIVFTNLISD